MIGLVLIVMVNRFLFLS